MHLDPHHLPGLERERDAGGKVDEIVVLLRDDERLALFGEIGQHFRGIGLEVADGLDLG